MKDILSVEHVWEYCYTIARARGKLVVAMQAGEETCLHPYSDFSRINSHYPSNLSSYDMFSRPLSISVTDL